MTACRHHVLEQGVCPKTNVAYTWWPLSVVNGLAQASYTVQRIEAQATSKSKNNKKTNKPKKQKMKIKKIWPNIAVGRLVAKSLFCFLWFGWLLCVLFGNFRTFSKMVDF